MVERTAQAVDVAAEIGLLPPKLLRRDVVGCAPDLGGLGIGRRSDAEVEELRGVALVEDDVLRLDVAMDQVGRGGELQPVRDVHADLHNHRLVKGGWRGYHVVEMAAADELHDDVGLALLLAEGIDLRDVRMVELGGGLGFAAERLEELRFLAKASKHDLDRHDARQSLVVGAVHAAHAPGSEASEKPVGPKPSGNRHRSAARRALRLRERIERRDVHGRLARRAFHRLDLVQLYLRLFRHHASPSARYSRERAISSISAGLNEWHVPHMWQ